MWGQSSHKNAKGHRFTEYLLGQHLKGGPSEPWIVGTPAASDNCFFAGSGV